MKLHKIALLPFLTILLFTVDAYGQAKVRKLPHNINAPSINLYAPYISGDGQTIIYLSDYTDDGHHSMHWATKKTVSTWTDGKEINKLVNRPTLNFRGGYCLSFDADLLLFTTAKAGIGGFDIWYSKRKGNDWEAPRNYGKPLNTDSNEGSPSLSPDGEYLYFMQCDKMETYKGASGCKLMRSKKTHASWEAGTPLPENINTGNSQTPRMLADGETLLFSSDQMGGKGGLDLFMTKKLGNNQWSDPVALDFVNTPEDDAFVSVPAKGRYLYRSVKGDRDHELVQLLIPEEYQPKDVMRIQGTITDETGAPLNAELTIFNIDNRDRLWNEKVGDKGDFAVVLKEGDTYDLSVDSGDPAYMYYSKIYDLQTIGTRDKERLNIQLKPLATGETYPLDLLFEEHGYDVRDISIYELRRLGDYLRKLESLEVEIQVHQMNYMEDSLKNNADLTENRIDTIFYNEPYVDPDLLLSKHDSLYAFLKTKWAKQTELTIDSVHYKVNLTDDSLHIEEMKVITSNKEPDTDSLMSDSTALISPPPMAEKSETSYPLTKFKTQMIYHNDRTEIQAESIQGFLIERGVKADQIKTKGYRKSGKMSENDNEQTVFVKMKILGL